MDTNTVKKFGFFVAGGAVGGLIGYLIAEIIIFQLDKQLDKEFENKWGLEFVDSEDSSVEKEPKLVEKKDYSTYSRRREKAELSKLVRDYIPESKEPRIISLEEYTNVEPSFSRETVTYYEDDGQFADGQEDPIDDPQNLLGPNVHLHFGEDSEDPDIVYVLNERQSTLYEVIRIHNSYASAVLGMPEPPKPKTTKRRRKVTKVDEDIEEEE